MSNRISLSAQIYAILTVLFLIILTNGLITAWYIYNIKTHLTLMTAPANQEICYTQKIMQAKKDNHIQAKEFRTITATAMLIEFFLGALLIFVFTNRIMNPLRKLTLKTSKGNNTKKSDDEIRTLSHNIQKLIEEAGKTYIELEQSREHLLQVEKMALVGKLAAGMAHSIRNPLTSVKMRLFSLNRTLKLSAPQGEDFEVISEEIRHIDNIVQNFLEFARPPKLKMQMISPSVVVDMAIQLLKHRLKSYNVNIKIIRERPLSETQADPEQLKEALINLIVNSCEAMEKDGLIVIQEKEIFDKSSNKIALIQLSDNGLGIPDAIKDKILQPFFTTKDEGTGLGLSITSRIIQEHHGDLSMTSQEGKGTTFTIILPIQHPSNSH